MFSYTFIKVSMELSRVLGTCCVSVHGDVYWWASTAAPALLLFICEQFQYVWPRRALAGVSLICSLCVAFIEACMIACGY